MVISVKNDGETNQMSFQCIFIFKAINSALLSQISTYLFRIQNKETTNHQYIDTWTSTLHSMLSNDSVCIPPLKWLLLWWWPSCSRVPWSFSQPANGIARIDTDLDGCSFSRTHGLLDGLHKVLSIADQHLSGFLVFFWT